MNSNRALIATAWDVASRNKRYVAWFYVLNFVLGCVGAIVFGAQAGTVLNHSLSADKLLHGFDLPVLAELLARPEFGPMSTASSAGGLSALLFFIASLIFMPGVFLGYSSDHRISRGEFYRACGHNLWRFVRLFVYFAIVAGLVGGILAGIQGALVKAADESSYELLPFITKMIGLTIMFLVLTVIRIWFDLGQTDVVLRDQSATRKSIAAGYRMSRGNLGRLLGTYVLIALVALLILSAGIVLWNMIVPAASVFGAFLVSQAILLLLLAVRFWQRAAAVSFYLRAKSEPAQSESAHLVPAAAV